MGGNLIFVLLFVGLSFWINPSSVFALSEDPCDSVRLDLTQKSFQEIPIWNQGKSNLCYAFAASILIDNHRLESEGVSEFTSPLILASQTVVYSKDKNILSSFWGGNLHQSLQVAQKEGVCDALFLSDGFSDEPLEKSIEDLRKIYRTGKRGSAIDKKQTILEIQDYLSAREILPPDSSKLFSFFAENEDQFIGMLIHSLCDQKITTILPEIKSKSRGSIYEGVSIGFQLNQVLTKEQKPVALDFCSDVVTNPDFATSYNSPCARHYAVAVGQRVNNGQCEILMRDSQCEVYNSIQKGRCENGYYWIQRKHLIGYVDNMTWL